MRWKDEAFIPIVLFGGIFAILIAVTGIVWGMKQINLSINSSAIETPAICETVEVGNEE